MKILIIDDESAIRRLIKDFLKREDFEVIEAVDGKDGVEKFKEHEHSISLVLLDIMMPYMDGFEVLTEIRKTSDVPVIMLTAKSEDYSQILGFDKGVNDYVTKPFSPIVLVSRIKNQLKNNASSIITVGDVIINNTQRKVFVKNKELSLTLKEYELLLVLAKNKNVALSRESLLESVWSENYDGDTRTLDTHIKQLRMKLSESEISIDTVRGFGYTLIV
jgi:DNA-binding response OmpR family regulator